MINTSEMISNSKIMSAVYCGMIDCSTSSDYIIPEEASDTDKILSADAVITLKQTEIGEKNVQICGSVCFDVLLMGEDGTLFGVTYSDDFRSSFVNDDITKNCTLILSNPQIKIDTRLINPRKISLSSVIGIPVTILDRIDPQVKITGAENISDEVGIQRKPMEIVSLKRTSHKEQALNVSHDIELDGNSPPMSKILYRHMKLVPYEIKARNNSVDIRTQANVTLIYLTEEGNVFSVCKSFIIDKSAEINDCEEYEWTAFISYDDLSVDIAANGYGEMKVVEIDFNYDVDLQGSKNDSVCAFSDMYSTDYECNTESKTVSVYNVKRTHGCSLSVNSSASREELGAESIRNVLTANARVTDTDIKYLPDKNKLLLSGSSEIEIVCENACLGDEDKRFSSYVYSYPFKCEFDCFEYEESDHFIPSVSISDIKYRADSSKLYCDFEASIKVTSYTNKDSTLVCAVDLDKNEPIRHVSMPFTLCYPSGSETVWDIAKYYKITSESIISTNSLENGEIIGKKVLLIPQSSKREAVFSKVI